jgi:hypothetical protein
MKKTIIFYCIFFICSFMFSKGFLISDSNKREITKEELQEKTLSFLTYARNEIFARHGYIFEDLDLSAYFTHQTWYEKSSNEIKLNDVEKFNVNLIKEIEEDREINSPKFPKGIAYKYNFNDKPLFYIGEMFENNKYYKDNYYVTGKLVLLDSTYLWTLDCNSIPPEFLEANNVGIISDLRDQCMMIEHSNRIQLRDIDSLENGINEIIIHERPESGSGEGTFKIVCEDINGNLKIIFSQTGKLKSINPNGNDKIKIELLRHTGYVTSSVIIYRYWIDRKNDVVIKIPLNYEEIIYPKEQYNKYTNSKKIPIYFDAVTAERKKVESIIGYTVIDKIYKIDTFYYSLEDEKLKSMSIEGLQLNIKGWINKDDLKISFRYFQAG